ERRGVAAARPKVARSAVAAGHEVGRAQPPTPRPMVVADALRIGEAGARFAAVAVYDALQAPWRAQVIPRTRPDPVSPAAAAASRRWIHADGAVFDAELSLESVVPSVLATYASTADPDGAVVAPPPGTVRSPALVRISRFAPEGVGARFFGL